MAARDSTLRFLEGKATEDLQRRPDFVLYRSCTALAASAQASLMPLSIQSGSDKVGSSRAAFVVIPGMS